MSEQEYSLLQQKLDMFMKEIDTRMKNYEKSIDFVNDVKTSIELIKVMMTNMEKTISSFTKDTKEDIGSLKIDFEKKCNEIKETQNQLEQRVKKIEDEPAKALKHYKMAIVTMLITTPLGLIAGAVISLIIK